MFQIGLLAAEAEHHVNTLPIPAWSYGAIALAAFLALAVVVASFTNVWHRHNHKLSDTTEETHH